MRRFRETEHINGSVCQCDVAVEFGAGCALTIGPWRTSGHEGKGYPAHMVEWTQVTGALAMPAKDWSKIYAKYKGLWVALKDDEVTVIAAATTLKEARQKANKAGHPHPIFTKMPSELTYFAG